MRRKAWIIVTACLAAVLICAACLVGVAAYRGIGVSKAVYIETSAGPMVLLHGGPVRVSGKEKLFEGLTMGDQVLLVHGPVMESYPGQSRAYWCGKLSDGTALDIPVQVLISLYEMGYQTLPVFIEESEAIAIAQEYAQIDPMDDWDVSTGWNCMAGIWTVTFSDVWVDGYIEVTVRNNGEVLACEYFE